MLPEQQWFILPSSPRPICLPGPPWLFLHLGKEDLRSTKLQLFSTSLSLLPLHESSVETTVVLPILSYKDVIDSVASVDSIIDSKGYESRKSIWENCLLRFSAAHNLLWMRPTTFWTHLNFPRKTLRIIKELIKKLNYVFPPRRHLSITNIGYDAVQAVIVTWLLALKRTWF